MRNFFNSNSKFLILVIIILALGLRLPLLNGSFWLDEAAQALESARPLAQQLDIIPDFQPPLIHLLVHFAMYFSRSEWWLRTIAALIPALITIYATYKLAVHWQQKSAGIIAALLLATSSFFIFYSQELRPYALPAMWAVLSWLALCSATNKAKPSWHKNWWLFVLWTCLGLYSSYLYPFFLFGQLGWLVVSKRDHLKHFYLTTGLAVLTFIPWIPTFLLQLAAGGELRQELPGWESIVSFSQFKSLPLVFGKFLFGVLNLELSPLFMLTGVVLAGTFLLIAWHWNQVRPKKLIVKNYQFEILLLCWLVIPLLVAWIVSFWIPIIQPKRVLYLLPAFYLLVGVIIAKLKINWVKCWALGVFLGLNLYSTASYYLRPELQRENWRSLQAEIARKYAPENTLAVFAFTEPFASWRWYDQGTFQTLSLGYLVAPPYEYVRDQLKGASEEQFVILFDYLTDISDPDHKLVKALESYSFGPIDIIDYPNIGFVRIYTRQVTFSSK